MFGELGFCLGFDNYTMLGGPSFASDFGFNRLRKELEINKSHPFFLFLHTFRVHAPYEDVTYAHEVMTETEVGDLSELIKHSPKDILLSALQEKLKEMGLYKKEVTENLYDGCIHETDKYIGRLIETLKKLNLFNNTIIVLTSDHGEEFGDHNPNKIYSAHGQSLYDELIRVPLVWVVPGNVHRGRRIKSQVRLIDIMPTLLDLVDIKYDAIKIQGTSLLPIIKGNSVSDELIAISEGQSKGKKMKSVRTNKLKYIYSVKLKDEEHGERILVADNPDEEELYDLEYDPEEKYNLQPEEPNLSDKLKNKINDILEDAVKTLSVKEDKRIEIDEETRNRLKALGYIQ